MTRYALWLLAMIPAVASAQGVRWERQVRNKLDRAFATIPANSARPLRLLALHMLNGEEWETVDVTLEAGVSYAIIGACDNDCTRLQLVLATATNSELAIDRNSDGLTMVRFTPQRTARYRVRITMEACELNPCWYGVGMAITPR
jgi:hypothetical protein